MIVEVRGAAFENKGAELMLHAVAQRAAAWSGGVHMALNPGADYVRRGPLGAYQKWRFSRFPLVEHLTGRCIPQAVRTRYGVILEREVDAVLDISGFAYSDQWGASKATQLARLAHRLKRSEKAVVLLPQALGPFEKSDVRTWFSRALDNIDLVFARDLDSYDHVRGLGEHRADIRMAPDFTPLVGGILPRWFETHPRHVAIVPNTRMVDKTSLKVGSSYFNILVEWIESLMEREFKPFVLVHEVPGDLNISKQIVSRFGGSVPMVSEPDARYLKGIIGSCHAVISSRFHAIVSALSQGVPCLGTGWSHKYPRLFEEYQCPECLVDISAPREAIAQKVELIADDHSHQRIADSLDTTRVSIREQIRWMWVETERVLGVASHPEPNSAGAGLAL